MRRPKLVMLTWSIQVFNKLMISLGYSEYGTYGMSLLPKYSEASLTSADRIELPSVSRR